MVRALHQSGLVQCDDIRLPQTRWLKLSCVNTFRSSQSQTKGLAHNYRPRKRVALIVDNSVAGDDLGELSTDLGTTVFRKYRRRTGSRIFPRDGASVIYL